MLRSTLGADFASVPTADDIAGTRNNMLSDNVLDGEKYPRIRIVGTGPMTRDGKQVLAVKVELLGRTVDLTVPTEVTISGRELRAPRRVRAQPCRSRHEAVQRHDGRAASRREIVLRYDVKARRDTR